MPKQSVAKASPATSSNATTSIRSRRTRRYNFGTARRRRRCLPLRAERPRQSPSTGRDFGRRHRRILLRPQKDERRLQSLLIKGAFAKLPHSLIPTRLRNGRNPNLNRSPLTNHGFAEQRLRSPKRNQRRRRKRTQRSGSNMIVRAFGARTRTY